MEIVSKFVVGSDQGVDEFFDVKKAFIRNSYQEIVASEIIENYIKEHFNHRKTINVLNDFSNQLIMVFGNQQPVGYCFFQTGSSYPEAVESQKMTAIKEFCILQEYDLPEVRLSLWNKVRSAIQFADSLWINIAKNDSKIQFFKNQKFVFVKDTVLDPFNLPSSIYELDLNKS